MNVAKIKGVVSTRPEPGAHLSKEFLLRLIEDAPAGILITRRRDHVVEFANRALGRLFGLTSIAPGRKVAVAMPGLGAEALALMNRVFATRSASSIDFEVRLRGGDVRVIRCKAWPRPDEDEDACGLVLLAQDVTPYAAARRGLEHLTDELRVVNERFVLASVRQHESAERAARQASQYTALLESLSDGVIVVDDTGRVLVVNQVAEKILGVEHDQLESVDDFRAVEIVKVDGTPLRFHERPLARALRGERVDAMECLIVQADGRRRHVTVSASSVPGPDDGSHLAILVCRDISELRRTEALRDASFERSEALRTIGEMATGIAHDLSNLMNPLSLQLSVLGRVLEIGDTERGGRAIEETRGVLRRAVETLARLNSFATGRPPTHMSPVDLVALTREAMLIAKPRMGTGMSRVIEELEPAPHVTGYASDIVRALVNLMCNAIDATRGGGTITLRSGAEDGVGWVEVVDDGYGMTPEVRKKAFEPFFTTKGGLGMGMGLAMVKECMDRHQGRVEVDSAPGRGTRIGLCFRADAAPAPASGIRIRRN